MMDLLRVTRKMRATRYTKVVRWSELPSVIPAGGRMKRLTLLLLVAGPLWAQEVVLKSGNKLPWKTITDDGDSILVENPAGQRVPVKKDDIARITHAGNAPVILTGAAITFDKKAVKAVNLLATLNIEKQAFAGEWKVTAGALSCAAVVKDGLTHQGRLMVVEEAPEEYDLQLNVERSNSKDAFGVVLVGGGRQFLFLMDHGLKMTSLWQLDGKDGDRSEVAKLGQILEDRRPRNVTVMVRAQGFVVQVDGKDHFSWAGDWNRLSMAPYHEVPKKKGIFLFIGGGEFKVRKALLVTT